MKQELQLLSVKHLVVKLMTLGPDSMKLQAYPLQFLKSVMTVSEANIECVEARANTSVLECCITCVPLWEIKLAASESRRPLVKLFSPERDLPWAAWMVTIQTGTEPLSRTFPSLYLPYAGK